MKEPRDSVDSFDWRVYSDYLQDKGESTESLRAKHISKGIEITGGKLYLLAGNPILFISAFNGLLESLDLRLDPSPEWNYDWTHLYDKYHSSHKAHDKAWNPLMFPHLFDKRTDVIDKFWNYLEKIGAENESLLSLDS